MRKCRSIRPFTLILLVSLFASTPPEVQAQNEVQSMANVSQGTARAVFDKIIYFGHQSVGRNILEGVSGLVPQQDDKIVNLDDVEVSDTPEPALYHSRVGANTDPRGKVDDFRSTIETQFAGGDLDIAFLKFCYVDIQEHTDVDGLFAYYRENIEVLQERFPETTFVHLTVPIRTSNETWKTKVKKLLGWDSLWEYADNIRRNEYNQLLLETFEGEEPVFDLAEIESTYPDGTRETFSFKGETYYALIPDYTNDGAHLNDTGSRRAGAALLRFLAQL